MKPMLFKRNESETPLFVQWFGPAVGGAAVFVAEILQIVIVAIAIIFVVRHFLVKPFVVKGASMEPNFYDSEYLIVDELTYRFHAPQRGDVVVFHPVDTCGQAADADLQESQEYYIKRVIGLPGERVQISEGTVTIFNDEYPNGVTLEESYTDEFTDGDRTWDIPADHYFLLGDNREESLDSRRICSQPIENIIGKAWVRGFPLDRMAVIGAPEYNF